MDFGELTVSEILISVLAAKNNFIRLAEFLENYGNNCVFCIKMLKALGALELQVSKRWFVY